jgi:hypothetical protein
MLVMLGVKRGLYLTIIMGYGLIPIMILVGVLFNLSLIYFLILIGLIAYQSLRLIQNQNVIIGGTKNNEESMLKLGEVFARDFVIIALVFTTSLMFSSYLTHQEFFLF